MPPLSLPVEGDPHPGAPAAPLPLPLGGSRLGRPLASSPGLGFLCRAFSIRLEFPCSRRPRALPNPGWGLIRKLFLLKPLVSVCAFPAPLAASALRLAQEGWSQGRPPHAHFLRPQAARTVSVAGSESSSPHPRGEGNAGTRPGRGGSEMQSGQADRAACVPSPTPLPCPALPAGFTSLAQGPGDVKWPVTPTRSPRGSQLPCQKV